MYKLFKKKVLKSPKKSIPQSPRQHQYEVCTGLDDPDYEKIPEEEPRIRSPKLITVAIDFGTTYTGYAFAFHYNYKEIYTSKHGGKLSDDRVPTVVLLSPDKKFHSFGKDAEDQYSSLVDYNRHQDWFYFEKFKMALYKTRCLTRETQIGDTQGRPMSAMVIFTMVIEHLRNNAKEIIFQSVVGMVESDIQWMITIPAIWSDSARQFMREAATKAGISDDNLYLVLEPEAASLFCMEQPSLKVSANPSCDEASKVVKFPVGHKYILADIGGGTVDICVHEIIAEGKLREIYRATGDDIGGTNVNREFWKFLEKLFGLELLTKSKQEFKDNFLILSKDFERQKTTFSKSKDSIILNLPVSLTDLIKKDLQTTMECIISNTEFDKCLDFLEKSNKLVLKKELLEQFFTPSLVGIVNLLQEILEETDDQDINTLLLVGGYSESPYLRDSIQSMMPDLKVQLISDMKHAVLKGAVMMGYKPQLITERMSRYTYGFAIMQPFENGKHPTSLRVEWDSRIFCDKIFAKQIEKGQSLEKGQVFISQTQGCVIREESKYTELHTKLYRSLKPDPTYCCDADCALVGRIIMVPPYGGWTSRVDFQTHLIVGETEFTVKVFDKATGAKYKANMDFL